MSTEYIDLTIFVRQYDSPLSNATFYTARVPRGTCMNAIHDDMTFAIYHNARINNKVIADNSTVEHWILDSQKHYIGRVYHLYENISHWTCEYVIFPPSAPKPILPIEKKEVEKKEPEKKETEGSIVKRGSKTTIPKSVTQV